MTQFELDFKLGTDILSIMKELDSGRWNNHEQIISYSQGPSDRIFCFNNDNEDAFARLKNLYDPFTNINCTTSMIRYSHAGGAVRFFHNGEIKFIENSDPILTPTEEQYFQNSLIYEQDLHLRIFIIYGIIISHDFKCDIALNYTQLDKLLSLVEQ